MSRNCAAARRGAVGEHARESAPEQKGEQQPGQKLHLRGGLPGKVGQQHAHQQRRERVADRRAGAVDRERRGAPLRKTIRQRGGGGGMPERSAQADQRGAEQGREKHRQPQEKIGGAHGDQRQRQNRAAPAHQRVGEHAAGQLAETDHHLLGRSERADFDVGEIQAGLERRQDHRIELLEPVNDEVAGRQHPQEPEALFAERADRCQETIHSRCSIVS